MRNVKTIILEPYQKVAVRFLSSFRRALLQSPAGSGKTIMAAFAIAAVLVKKPRSSRVRVGWIANTREQCDQANAALDACPGLRVQIDVIVCCAAGAPSISDRELVIIDEAHHIGSDQWRGIIADYPGALWLMTATPFGEDEERNDFIRALCEGHIHVVPRSAVADRVLHGNVVMLSDTDHHDLRTEIDDRIEEDLTKRMSRFSVFYPPENATQWVKIAQSQYPGIPQIQDIRTLRAVMQPNYVKATDRTLFEAVKGRMWSQIAYLACMQIGIVPNQRRNSAILRKMREHVGQGDTVITLVYSVAHGEALAEQIPGSRVLHSKMRKRAVAMEQMKSGELRAVFATSLLDEGFDCQRANVLIQAGAGRSKRAAEQRTGRVLRAFGEQTHGTIYDFHDTFHSLTANQSKKRQDVYRSLGYTVRNESELNQPALI